MGNETDKTAALDRDYFTIFDWMMDPSGLNLKNNELLVFAKIYSMSHHSRHGYIVGQEELASSLFIHRSTIYRALEKLVASGLIECRDVFESISEARGFRCPKAYCVVQDRVNEAINGTTPANKSGLETDFDALRLQMSFQQSAGRKDVASCNTNVADCDSGSVENPSFQQSAGRKDVASCNVDVADRNMDVATCDTHVASCNVDVADRNMDPTCGNVKFPFNGSGISTCGNVPKPQDSNSNADIYKNINGIEVDINPLHSTTPVPTVDARGNEGMSVNNKPMTPEELIFIRILHSSPKTVSKPYYNETLAAYRRRIREGYEPEVIGRAWEMYLDFISEKNADQGSIGLQKWSMFPSNFFDRRDGLRYWAEEAKRDMAKTAAAAKTVEPSVTADGSAKAPGAESEAIARKFRLKMTYTTEGPRWLYVDRFRCLLSCDGNLSKRDAIKRICAENGLAVPEDINEVTDERGKSNAA